MKFQLGRGADPQPPPLGYDFAPSEENKKGAGKFSAMFLAFSNKIATVQKIVLSSSRGQGNFRGLEASRPRPRPRTWPSRPRPRPRTWKCVLEDVLEAKDVLEDSTSAIRPTVISAGRTKLRVSKNFFRGDIFLYLLNIFATAVPKLKQKISKIIVQF